MNDQLVPRLLFASVMIGTLLSLRVPILGAKTVSSVAKIGIGVTSIALVLLIADVAVTTHWHPASDPTGTP